MDSSPNLFIVRTPFQAWICLQLIDHLKLSGYDLVYITHNDSDEDRFYFKRLSSRASIFDYVYLAPQRFDIITHVKLRLRMSAWFRRCSYKNIYVASINALIINALVCRLSSSNLYTFDDGVANLVKGGPYYVDPKTARLKIYRLIFGGQSVEKVRRKIKRHYSLHEGFDNIVSSRLITYLNGWFEDKNPLSNMGKEGRLTKKYFIGAPFEEVMSRHEIDKMVDIMRDVDIDGYIRHPRENIVLPIGGRLLEKRGRIAEEVIVEESEGCSLELYGFLSGVMFNLHGFSEKRVVFLPGRKRVPELSVLAKKLGCKEIYLS